PVSEQAELFDTVTLQDDGDVSLVDGDMGANVEHVAAEIGRTPEGTLPIVLGGDHTTVSPTLIAQQRRLNGRLSILYIDAHPDLNDISRQMRWSNGCALRRGLEMGGIDPRKVTLLGCRDYDWEEVEFIRKMGVTLIPAATAHRWTGNQLADEIGSRIGSDALHISLDIVGEGVMGCSLAFYLARQGRSVIVIDRGRIGQGATAACAGGIRAQFSTEVNIRIGMEAKRVLSRFADETGATADFRQVGYL